jgi:hypothetical protein
MILVPGAGVRTIEGVDDLSDAALSFGGDF